MAVYIYIYILFFFFGSGDGKGEGGGGGLVFFIENPRRGAVSQECGGARGGREDLCREYRGGGGLNIFFRGRNARQVRVRTATQRSKKGSEKVLERVLEKGSQGSEKGACSGFYSKKGF